MTSRPQFSLRMLLFVIAMVCLAAATVSPRPTGQLAWQAQTLLRAALCVAFPATLATGAVHARGYLRTLFLGGLFPAATALFIVCLGIAGQWRVTSYDTPEMLNLWHSLQDHASFIAGLWAFIPISGVLCVFVHWLFQPGDPRDKDREDRGAKPDQSRLRK